MVFTSIEHRTKPQILFDGGDPQRPQFRGEANACRIEQLPQLIGAFRVASPSKVQLNRSQLANLAEILVKKPKSSAKPRQKRIADYVYTTEHHFDPFLDCKIYPGEGELLKEPVWIKEYDQVLASPDQPDRRTFPQHKNIVVYRAVQATASHLYIILERKPRRFSQRIA
jgi:hypothetical protein